VAVVDHQPVRRPHTCHGRGTDDFWYSSRVRVRANLPWPGLLIAGLSFGLNLLWVAAIKPLNAPDEPAHLQAIMQVREQHILPEVHYTFPTPRGKYDLAAGDQAAKDYTRQMGRRGEWPLIPYESMQAPLYYVTAGLLVAPIPPNPEHILYWSRILAALFGAGTVFFCWA